MLNGDAIEYVKEPEIEIEKEAQAVTEPTRQEIDELVNQLKFS